MHPSVRLEAALRATAEWQAAETVDELARRACETLLALIPADGAGWNELDIRGGRLRVVVHPLDYFPERHGRLAELLPQNPLLESLPRFGPQARTFSDVVSVREYHSREIYNEVYRNYAIEEQLGGFVSIEGEAGIALALNRGRRTFTELDRRLLDLLRGQAAAAYRTVLDRNETRIRIAALERGLDAAHAAVVFLSPHGTVRDASERARNILSAWFDSGLPEPGRYRRDGRTLTVRRVDGDAPLLLLDEHHLAPEPAHGRELGLTQREAEIVALAARGLDNRTIARQLFLSPRTIQKHLERAYAKLRVTNRTEAAQRLLEGADSTD